MATSFPPNPTPGQTYTYSNKTWVWNGTSWVATAVPTTTSSPVYISSYPPPNPVSGSLWYDSLNNSLNIYYNDLSGGAWIAVVPYPQDDITQQGGVFEGPIYGSYEIPTSPTAFVTAYWVQEITDPLSAENTSQQIEIDALTAQQAATQAQLDALQTAFDDYVATHP